MKKTVFLFGLLSLFVFLSSQVEVHAQKDITIDPLLEQNSVKYKVKLGTVVLGKMAKYQFGDYKILEGKAGGTVTKGKSNFFNTQSESNTKSKYSFVLGDKSSNRVSVNAVKNSIVKLKQQSEIFSGFYVGEDELLLDKSNFSATLVLNQDTSQMWLLFLKDSYGTEADQPYQGILTNGERTMQIIPVSSDVPNKGIMPLQAMGYEFLEDGKPWAAVQYRGGGALGMNRCYAWLHQVVDPEMKLIVSAALMALLHEGRSSFTGIGGRDVFDD